MSNESLNIPDKLKEHAKMGPSAAYEVPDGYFDDFAARMSAKLPYRPEIEDTAEAPVSRPSFWQRIRPYVYMAAMFAGVWCMLQMFTMISGADTRLDSDRIFAEATADETLMAEYVYDNINAWDLVDEMYNDGTLDSDADLDSFFDEISDDSSYL